MFKPVSEKREGQMMLLIVLILSSIIAVVAALAGLLITLQLRQVTDARQSAEAIFAADTGIECILFREFGPQATVDCPSPDTDYVFPGGGPKFRISRTYLDPVTGSETWVSVGRDSKNRIARALQIKFVKQ
ncbi:MAG: hypothetical protein HYW37_00490 [Candidatus Colwellbacteria bacterium]|nr:hypothetical protein [Candidatus Colwellbacteria bacterium]